MGGTLLDVGKNIVLDIWNGIKNSGTWLLEQIGGFFGGIIDGVKGFLGIKSPSKVFADIGKNMGLGIGTGFTDSMKSVERDMKNAIPMSFGSPQLAFAGVNGNVGYGSNNNRRQSGSGVTQNLTINSPVALSPSEIATESKNALRRLAWQ